MRVSVLQSRKNMETDRNSTKVIRSFEHAWQANATSARCKFPAAAYRLLEQAHGSRSRSEPSHHKACLRPDLFVSSSRPTSLQRRNFLFVKLMYLPESDPLHPLDQANHLGVIRKPAHVSRRVLFVVQQDSLLLIRYNALIVDVRVT